MKMKQLLITTIAIFGLATITFGQTVPSYLPNDGLVGWWPFNGNANDESGNNFNGNVVGPILAQDRFGSSLSAYNFDGQNDYIFMGSMPSLSTANNNGFTIALWFNSNTYSAISTDLYDIRSTNTSSNQIYINDGSCGSGCVRSQNFDFPTWLSSSGTIGGFSFNSFTNFVTNNWVFVVYSQNYLTNENKIYVNGLLSNDTLTQNISLFNPDFNIGSRYSPYVGSPIRCCYFSGVLDDIGIWNRALTQEEITSLYYGSPLGINEDLQSNLFSVFPNPAQNVINVNLDAKLVGSVFSIYDNIGKVVKTGKINSVNTTIEINDLSGSIYTFSVGENKKQTFKVIKE